jgi:RNA polymerase sigma-70 factor (ECF subfamily)
MAQEVFLAAYSGMGGFRQEASVRTWLTAIARNQCLNHIKKRGRRRLLKNEKRDEIVENVHPVSRSVFEDEQDEQVKLVKQGLKNLSGSERALLIMRYDTGLPIADVAHILGISVSSVRRRLARSLRHLKELINNE